MATKAIKDLFGIESQGSIQVKDGFNPLTPMTDDLYVFRPELLEFVLGWMRHPFGKGLMLTGLEGTGKTSLIEQISARLNRGYIEITADAELELAELKGTWSPSKDGMTFEDGLLTKALREGHVFMINEIDLMRPGQQSALNEILQGKPLSLPTGEVVYQHPDFRFAATGNSKGQGDSMGRHAGVRRMNAAFRTRFEWLEVDYAAPEVEIGILVKAGMAAAAQLGATKVSEAVIRPYAERMVKLAGMVRDSFRAGLNGSADTSLTVTLSSRTLVAWIRRVLQFSYRDDTLSYTFDKVLVNSVEPHEAEALRRMAKDVMGDLWQ